MQKPEKPKVYHSNKYNDAQLIMLTAKAEDQKYVLSQIDESDLAQFDKAMRGIQLKIWLLAGMFTLPLILIPMYHQQNNIVMWLTLEEKYRQVFPKNYYAPFLFTILGIPYLLYKFDDESKKYVDPIVEKYDFIYEPQQTLK